MVEKAKNRSPAAQKKRKPWHAGKSEDKEVKGKVLEQQGRGLKIPLGNLRNKKEGTRHTRVV